MIPARNFFVSYMYIMKPQMVGQGAYSKPTLNYQSLRVRILTFPSECCRSANVKGHVDVDIWPPLKRVTARILFSR
jgi:hypothetical protein